MRHKAFWPALAVVLSLVVASPALAAAPATGTVVEGKSVPGLALGETRAVAEASYGAPTACQHLPYFDGRSGLNGICDFPAEGGGQVTVYYQDADGGPAQDSPNDVIFNIRWTQPVSGWTTVAGINTELALENPDAVVAAYPNAVVTYNPLFGNVESIEDAALGILVDYQFDYLSATTSVTMSIRTPRTPPPSQEDLTRVDSIDLTTGKVKGRRYVRALVAVRNDHDLAARGATVFATWLLSDGATQAVTGTTSGSGYASFELTDARRGVYSLRIDDVVLDGHRFDRDNSTLLASIEVR